MAHKCVYKAMAGLVVKRDPRKGTFNPRIYQSIYFYVLGGSSTGLRDKINSVDTINIHSVLWPAENILINFQCPYYNLVDGFMTVFYQNKIRNW